MGLLTETQAADLLAWADGSLTELAQRFGISRQRAHQITHPTQAKAWSLTAQFYRRKLRLPNCQQCGATKTEAHHPDYNKPLEVIWLCRYHHLALHVFLRETRDMPKNEAAVAMAHRRALSMSARRRRQIARLAAEARWAKAKKSRRTQENRP